MKTYVVEKTDDTVTLGLKNADMTIIQALMDTVNNIEDVLLVRYDRELDIVGVERNIFQQASRQFVELY